MINKSKKMKYITYITLVVVVIIISIVGINILEKQANERYQLTQEKLKNEESQSDTNYEVEEDNETTSTVTTSTESNDDTQRSKFNSVKSEMEYNFGGQMNVYADYNNKLITLTVANQSLKQEIRDYIQYGLNADEWEFFLMDMRYASQFVYDEMGFGYTIEVLNPDDDSKAIVRLKDGSVTSSI